MTIGSIFAAAQVVPTDIKSAMGSLYYPIIVGVGVIVGLGLVAEMVRGGKSGRRRGRGRRGKTSLAEDSVIAVLELVCAIVKLVVLGLLKIVKLCIGKMSGKKSPAVVYAPVVVDRDSELDGPVCRGLNRAEVAGAIGESDLVKRLLSDSRCGQYVVIPDVWMPHPGYEPAQIDVVVIAPGGVFSLEMKDWSGWVFGRFEDRDWIHKDRSGSSRWHNPIRQNFSHVDAIVKSVGLPQDCVHGIVVFRSLDILKGDLDCLSLQEQHGVTDIEHVVDCILSHPPAVAESDFDAIRSAIIAWKDSVSESDRARRISALRSRYGYRV